MLDDLPRECPFRKPQSSLVPFGSLCHGVLEEVAPLGIRVSMCVTHDALRTKTAREKVKAPYSALHENTVKILG